MGCWSAAHRPAPTLRTCCVGASTLASLARESPSPTHVTGRARRLQKHIPPLFLVIEMGALRIHTLLSDSGRRDTAWLAPSSHVTLLSSDFVLVTPGASGRSHLSRL